MNDSMSTEKHISTQLCVEIQFEYIFKTNEIYWMNREMADARKLNGNCDFGIDKNKNWNALELKVEFLVFW